MKLGKRVIIITGASSGIGAATAIACARAGMRLVLNARREDKLQEVAEIALRIGVEVEVVVSDVTADGASEELLSKATHRFGGFDVVLSNAGYGLEYSTLHMPNQMLREIFDVNFFSSVDLLQKAGKQLIESQKPGHLLMTSSCVAKFTIPYYAAYSATKAAQNHICRSLRLEMKPYGIEVSSIHPITTTSEFFQAAEKKVGGNSNDLIPEHTPKMFIQTPERVANAIVKCLRKPRAEVWTSHIVRFSAALMTMFPSLFDITMTKEVERRRHIVEDRHNEPKQ